MSYQDRKRREYLKAKGFPPLVPAGPVSDHVRILHDRYGMSTREIGSLSGLSCGSVHKLLNRYYMRNGQRIAYESVGREKAARVLAVRPSGPVKPETSRAGALVDATGARRRVQALNALGFPLTFISLDILGVNINFSRELSRRDTLFRGSDELVRQVYPKWEAAEPDDHGIALNAASKCRKSALRKGWAPPSCWDPDTIDDPEAIPEWTGECGTPRGERIHRREGIPTCEPCRTARKRNKRTLGRPEFDRDRFTEIRESAGYSKGRLEREAELAKGSLSHWESGRNQPLPHALERVMVILGAPVSEVYEEEEE